MTKLLTTGLLDTQPTLGQPNKSCLNINIYLHKEESINLRKFSTVSGISSVSTVSTKTLQSEMVISEEDEDRTDELQEVHLNVQKYLDFEQ